jgi:hypothetical protein
LKNGDEYEWGKGCQPAKVEASHHFDYDKSNTKNKDLLLYGAECFVLLVHFII